MDAFELLEKDHRKVEGIFAQLEETTERAVKTRGELFEKLKMELDIHTQIEETVLYPVLKQVRDTREITFEGYEEHGVAKTLLEEMSTLDVSDEVWTAKLKVLKESIEHHVEEEETEMFKDARENLSKEQINDLGMKLESAKQELKATMSASA
jgi:iron-sulfur cluster repair protein YtfE (RIC family)